MGWHKNHSPGIGKQCLGLKVPQGAQQGMVRCLLRWEGVGLCNAIPLCDTDLPISYQWQGLTYHGLLYIWRPPWAGQPLATTTFLSFPSAVITPLSCWGSPSFGLPHLPHSFHLCWKGSPCRSRAEACVPGFGPTFPPSLCYLNWLCGS